MSERCADVAGAPIFALGELARSRDIAFAMNNPVEVSLYTSMRAISISRSMRAPVLETVPLWLSWVSKS